MEHFVIPVVAFLASLLTFFSGFGLGTLLTPVFALFFPVQLAVGQTSIVHFINNTGKIILVGKHINIKILVRFGIPALLASGVGAWALMYFSELPAISTYSVGGKIHSVTPVNLVIGLLIILFSLLEFMPLFSKEGFHQRYLVAGGLLSGFFGGLSGNQGALRSAFLIKYNLTKEEYVATGTAIAMLIDSIRILFYFQFMQRLVGLSSSSLIITSTLAALTGALTGNYLLKKVTLKFIQQLTHGMLIIIGLALACGII